MKKTNLELFYDKKGRTLSVWFDDPKKEVICEEVGDGVILSKDKEGNVIGFEKLYFEFAKGEKARHIPVQVALV